MSAAISQARQPEPVTQFSVFTANRVGRLNQLIGLLSASAVHVLAITILDTTDSAIIRIVVDDPEKARTLLQDEAVAFTESKLLVVEVGSATELSALMAALLEAEINVNYLYSFIPHPAGKSLLALSMEDNEMAEQVLTKHQYRILKQGDLSR